MSDDGVCFIRQPVHRRLLREIDPRRLAEWLRLRGWRLHDIVHREGSKIGLDMAHAGGDFAIIPLNPKFLDYELRMKQALESICSAEKVTVDHVAAWSLFCEQIDLGEQEGGGDNG